MTEKTTQDDKNNEMKIIKEKRLTSCKINCLELIKYKNKDYIVIGLNESYSYKSIIQIYEAISLKLIGRNDTDLGHDEINYISQMYNQNLLVCGYNLRIFALYFKNAKLNMKLVQLTKYPDIDNKYGILRVKQFKKAFVLDRNLYRDPENQISSLEGEILVNGSVGMFIYKRMKKENNETNNEEGNLSINYLEKSEDINEITINDYAEKWNNNPYMFNDQVSFTINFDVIQINYKYLAVTRASGYICILDIETKNLITIFEVKSSLDADRVIFMLNKDIICVGGDDGLSLISIKDFDVPLLCVLKPNFKVTEICIMDEFNILITMRSDSYNFEEYLLHYKLIPEKDNLTNKTLYNAMHISSELTSKRRSNLTMASIDRNKFVCVIENKVWSGEGCNQLEDYERYINSHQKYSHYKHKLFIFLTPNTAYDCTKLYKNYVRIDYGKICWAIDKVLNRTINRIAGKKAIFLLLFVRPDFDNELKWMGVTSSM